MAVITPQTDLILLKCPLEVDQQNQLTFANATGQYNYFYSLPKLAVSNFTYQREDSTVRFPAQVDTIRSYNYCMYRNTAYSNKWFYAFITGIRYVNDKMTELKLKTDVWQTWQFDITLKSSFVEREHVADDTIGLHTLAEEPEAGEYMINSVTNKTICAPDVDGAYIVLSVTEPPIKSNGQSIIPSDLNNRCFNGIIQGCYIIMFYYNTNGLIDLNNAIEWYDAQGKKDSINSIYAIPKTVYPAAYIREITITDPFEADILWPITHTGATDMSTTTITLNNTLNGYTPKNNKMFCYPFNYLMVTNNNGTNSIYHYEDFTTPSSVQFKYNGVLTEGSDIKAYPVNYKKNTTNYAGYAYGVDMGKTPTFSWTNDMYLNWKAQNSFNGMYNQAGNVVNTYEKVNSNPRGDDALAWMGQMAEAGMNYVGSAINAVTNAVTGSAHKASITPDQANGTTTADLNFSIGRCGFTFYQMSVRAEVAAMIDNYLSMFGYKVNTMKSINITSRRYWNYIKCIQANITGDIPQDDMKELKGYFNSGITFWHDPTKYLDYSQTNAIVS